MMWRSRRLAFVICEQRRCLTKLIWKCESITWMEFGNFLWQFTLLGHHCLSGIACFSFGAMAVVVDIRPPLKRPARSGGFVKFVEEVYTTEWPQCGLLTVWEDMVNQYPQVFRERLKPALYAYWHRSSAKVLQILQINMDIRLHHSRSSLTWQYSQKLMMF